MGPPVAVPHPAGHEGGHGSGSPEATTRKGHVTAGGPAAARSIGSLLRAAAGVGASFGAALAVALPAGASGGGYGPAPRWLPQPAGAVGRVVTASAAHPWLAIEGDSVRVDLPRGHALVTTVGPAVPQSGVVPVPQTSPCTFTVTIAQTAGTVPVAASAFTITDQFGRQHHPLVTMQGATKLPSRAESGHPLTLTVYDILPTGSGTLHWAPNGPQPVVSWDFNVEVD